MFPLFSSEFDGFFAGNVVDGEAENEDVREGLAYLLFGFVPVIGAVTLAQLAEGG